MRTMVALAVVPATIGDAMLRAHLRRPAPPAVALALAGISAAPPA